MHFVIILFVLLTNAYVVSSIMAEAGTSRHQKASVFHRPIS